MKSSVIDNLLPHRPEPDVFDPIHHLHLRVAALVVHPRDVPLLEEVREDLRLAAGPPFGPESRRQRDDRGDLFQPERLVFLLFGELFEGIGPFGSGRDTVPWVPRSRIDPCVPCPRTGRTVTRSPTCARLPSGHRWS